MKKYLLYFFLSTSVFSQTTGKISGIIIEKGTANGLPGANVYLVNTGIGTASNVDGRFNIINVQPGSYSFKVDMIGYKSIQIDDLIVSVNRTSTLKIEMESTVIEGEVVTVEVERMTQKKDQTGTIKNISGDEINALAVEGINSVINMQAGVVQGHFRGGRNTEVSYMIDGVQVDESFGGGSAAVEIQPEAVQDLEVITGTFNAEYGRAMSGVVNVVTREGGSKFEGSASGAISIFHTNIKDDEGNEVFIGLSPSLNKSQDLKISIGGPIIKNKVTFFTNVRSQSNLGHLNGYRLFNVTDSSNFYLDDPTSWTSQKTGDRSYVPMNTSSNFSLMGKLAMNFLKGIRLSTLYTYSDDSWFDYDHAFKYNPDGRAGTYKTTHFLSFHLNHMITPNFFYEVKLSHMKNQTGTYVYENPLDSNYVHDKYLENYGSGFYTGGQQKNHNKLNVIDSTLKIDLTWQMNQTHSLKFGFMGIAHGVDHQWRQIRNKYDGQSNQEDLYEPEVFGDSTVYADIYKVYPKESALYIQDKVELDEMVINLGLRYDYFNPFSHYPSNRRNPANQLTLPDSMLSTYPIAPVIDQISPRVGFAYQLGSEAVLHFSYGHFFQMPPLYSMYQNHSFLVSPSDYSTTMGNVLLKPEKTITYEIGLWQELTKGFGLDVALFYRDIYNLLSTKIISTYNQIEYGLYSNKDYGNVRGLEVKLDLGYGQVKGMVNYTLQYTRGNADSPTQSFTRAGNNMDPVNRFIPMGWDQRHTLNGTIVFSSKNLGGSLTGYYNSGTPYTFSPQSESVLSRVNLYPNNDYKPPTFTVDGTFYYNFRLFNQYKAKIDLTVYNVFDRLNESWVNSETGHAYTAVIKDTDLASHRSDYNTYLDRVKNPSMFSSPRNIKLSVGINF